MPPDSWQPRVGSLADPRFWRPVDNAYERLLQHEQAHDPHPWLLMQTMVTGVPRRALYGALGLRPGWRVLDVGTGFAPVALEVAGAFGCRVVGVDSDLDQLRGAARVARNLRMAEWLRPAGAGEEQRPATASLAAGTVSGLPFGDGAFEAVVARFLVQHVTDPAGAVAELARVTVPGGVVCVIDVDDGLSMSHPEPPEPVRRLEAAYQRAQHQRGGDRTIGRKIAGLLDSAGVAVGHVLVLPQAAYGRTSPADWSQRLMHARLSAVAGEIVERGLADEAAVAEGLRLLATEEMPAATTVDMHLAVIGRRRP
jgi:ubiquinone/menaquinone biosynthesis C-methylase UbiE